MIILAIDPGNTLSALVRKTCSNCGSLKPYAAFYRNKATKDGRGSWCIDSERNRNRSDYTKGYRETLNYRDCQAKYRSSRKHHLVDAARQRRSRSLYPEKARARDAVKYAKRIGAISPPLNCEGCGDTTKVQAHHPDYTRRLDVEWLCPQCHTQKELI
jgi:hypothetical protein